MHAPSLRRHRRIAAIVLPHLLCELAGIHADKRKPCGVVLMRDSDNPLSVKANAPLADVNAAAINAGLRPGLTITEATAFESAIEVRVVLTKHIDRALARIAEASLAFSPTVGISASHAIQIDLTGVTHLHSDEKSLLRDIQARILQMGHVARVAIAQGPRIAELIARHSHLPVNVVEPGNEKRYMHNLPVAALPISDDSARWLNRLGVRTIGDFCALPHDQASSRLGGDASQAIAISSGHDPSPIQRFAPPLCIFEETEWDDGIDNVSALLFKLARLTSNLAFQLQTKCQSLRSFSLTLKYDVAVARYNDTPESSIMCFELPTAIHRADELLRIVRVRLETASLSAPVVGMRIEATMLATTDRVQLDISHRGSIDPYALPSLLAELSSEIGSENLGTLGIVDSHRPEARSVLRPACSNTLHRRGVVSDAVMLPVATRLLSSAIPLNLTSLDIGGQFAAKSLLSMRIENSQFHHRLSDVEWWTTVPVSRDYHFIWVSRGASVACAWVYRDHSSGTYNLHGWIE